MKLGAKISILYAIAGIIVSASIGALLWSNLRTQLFSTKLAGIQDQLVHVDYGLTLFFDQVEQNLLTLADDDAVRFREDGAFTNFTTADEAAFRYAITPAEQRIIDLFRRYKENHPYVNSVYMGRTNGSFVRSHPRARPTRYDPRTRPWYLLASHHPRRVMLTSPYVSVTTADVNLGTVKALLDDRGDVFGVVGMDITLETLTGYVKNVSVGHDGYLLLLDRDGTILASRDKAMVFQHIESLCRDDLSPLFSGENGSLRFTRQQETHYIVFRSSPKLGWKIAFVIPTREIDRSVARFVAAIIGVLVLSLAGLSALTLFGLGRFVVRPLNALAETARAIARSGDLDHPIAVSARDEIGSLARSFQQMTGDLKDHIRRLTESTAARERMEGELKIAHDIQMGILPRDYPKSDAVDVFAALEPARQVGGDFYDIFYVDERHLCLVIGDVSGKGVPAAVFMSGAKTLIKAVAHVETDPAQILTRANGELAAGNDYGTFVTVFLGILDLDTGAFVYSSAGHNPPLLLDPVGPPDFVSGGRSMVLGMFEETQFVADRLHLAPGQGLFLYTDGVTEAFGPGRELFGEERLAAVLERVARDPAQTIVDSVFSQIRAFAQGTDPSDDITMLVLKLAADSSGSNEKKAAMGPARRWLTLPNQRDKIQALMLEAVAFWASGGLGDEMIHDLRLATEEIVTNIITHGFEIQGGATIHVDLELTAAGAVVEIRDKGKPFDPASHYASEELEKPFEDRNIGGMGIHLVRSLTDALEYQRRGDENVVRMKKFCPRNPQ